MKKAATITQNKSSISTTADLTLSQKNFFTQDFMYTNSNNTSTFPGMEYPNAQYIATDFHCERALNSWTDPFLLNNGWLVGLADPAHLARRDGPRQADAVQLHHQGVQREPLVVTRRDR